MPVQILHERHLEGFELVTTGCWWPLCHTLHKRHLKGFECWLYFTVRHFYHYCILPKAVLPWSSLRRASAPFCSSTLTASYARLDAAMCNDDPLSNSEQTLSISESKQNKLCIQINLTGEQGNLHGEFCLEMDQTFVYFCMKIWLNIRISVKCFNFYRWLFLQVVYIRSGSLSHQMNCYVNKGYITE